MHKKYYYLVMCVESQLEGNLCFQKLEILKIWFLKQVEIIPSITDPQFPSAMQLEALKALLEATAADITPPEDLYSIHLPQRPDIPGGRVLSRLCRKASSRLGHNMGDLHPCWGIVPNSNAKWKGYGFVLCMVFCLALELWEVYVWEVALMER